MPLTKDASAAAYSGSWSGVLKGNDMNRRHVTVGLVAVALVACVAWTYWAPSKADAQRGGGHAAALAPASSTTKQAQASHHPRSTPKASMPTAPKPVDVHRAVADFEQSKQCYSMNNRLAELERNLQACKEIPSNDLARSAQCTAGLQEQMDALDKERDEKAECSTAQSSARDFYEATKKAASMGDADAQVCYLRSLFEDADRTPLSYSQQEIRDYKRLAPKYIAEGMARGDWRVVALLAQTSNEDGSGMFPYVHPLDPLKLYTMNRLLQLGADAPYAQRMNAIINVIFLSPTDTGGPILAPSLVAQGNKQAEMLFHKYFEGKPRLKEAPSACGP
ncbi:MAG TPA: hypothetical protein VFH59_15920 [Frateuria sp.]|uniref:hypothetical protein n=1 Tax=Frateuria sp. TaxID=2211372 RepID=UPI002D8107D4|nr:hypothetical protein [Frateuria sp.]HET6806921.1 hypothetical protein [Frateuria sp.]